jgi:hypothetical protein
VAWVWASVAAPGLRLRLISHRFGRFALRTAVDPHPAQRPASSSRGIPAHAMPSDRPSVGHRHRRGTHMHMHMHARASSSTHPLPISTLILSPRHGWLGCTGACITSHSARRRGGLAPQHHSSLPHSCLAARSSAVGRGGSCVDSRQHDQPVPALHDHTGGHTRSNATT